MIWGAGAALGNLRGYFAGALVQAPPPGDLTAATCGRLLWDAAFAVVRCCLPVIAGALAMGVAANVCQGSLVFTGVPLTPNMERINPVSGLKRIVSRRALLELVKALLKVSIVGLAAFLSVAPRVWELARLPALSPQDAVVFTGDLASQVVLRTAGALLLVAAVDYAYQRWEHEKNLRMTRDELKEELKETEGDPKLRGRIRQRQREIARRRMMAAVPKADAVVTNPTHYACALVYESGRMPAPRVVAKGRNHLAVRIREIAREHHVPVVQNPALARALYAAVEVGECIPPELYRAVAEVLAFVYRLRGKVA